VANDICRERRSGSKIIAGTAFHRVPAPLHRFVRVVLPRDAMLARHMPSSRVRLSVRPSVTSQYCTGTTGRIELVFGIEASFHLSHTVLKEIWVSPKLGYFPLGLCSKLRTQKILPRHVDRVVNNTRRRRRRRRSSLLTTPIRQSTSRGCLLRVNQL